MTATPSELIDLRERSTLLSVATTARVPRYYAAYLEWDKDNPCPIHPEHGPQQTPPVWVYEIWDDDGTPLHVMRAEIPAGAPWLPPDQADNKQSLAFTEYICALLNFGETVRMPDAAE